MIYFIHVLYMYCVILYNILKESSELNVVLCNAGIWRKIGIGLKNRITQAIITSNGNMQSLPNIGGKIKKMWWWCWYAIFQSRTPIQAVLCRNHATQYDLGDDFCQLFFKLSLANESISPFVSRIGIDLVIIKIWLFPFWFLLQAFFLFSTNLLFPEIGS